MSKLFIPGETDWVELELGGSDFQYGLMGGIVRVLTDTWGTIISNADPAGANKVALFLHGTEHRICWADPGGLRKATIELLASDGWCWVAMTKATGTHAPRMHKLKFSDMSWLHEDATGFEVGDAASQVGGTIRIGQAANSDYWPGRIDLVVQRANVTPLDDSAIEDLFSSPDHFKRDYWLTKGFTLLNDETDFFDNDYAGSSDSIALHGTDGGPTDDADDAPNWSDWAGPTDSAPSNSVASAITGTPQVGQLLTVGAGTWSGTPTPTVTRKWQRSDNGSTGWSDISGATGTTYTVQGADESKYLRVLESAENTVSTVTQASNVVGPVSEAPALAFSWRLSGGASESDLDSSHGGVKSNVLVTQIPGLMGLSSGDTNTRTSKYWCFYLHNSESTRSFTAKFWFTEQPEGGDVWEVGLGVASAGSTETATADNTTVPSSVTFESPTDEDGALEVTEIAPGEGKAIWLHRPADLLIPADVVGMELHFKLEEVLS